MINTAEVISRVVEIIIIKCTAHQQYGDHFD